jgi:hypothetical protein
MRGFPKVRGRRWQLGQPSRARDQGKTGSCRVFGAELKKAAAMRSSRVELNSLALLVHWRESLLTGGD